jgi:K+-transporting ATPase ATPase C chain
MKKELLPSILLTLICIVCFCVVYPAIVWVMAQAAPGKGGGQTVMANGRRYYSNIAQKFTDDKYFWSRPSAVDYNAAGSGGSNKGPSNPEYLATVQQRIDSFLLHNPGVKKTDIPSDMVTASGSGLDPDISVQGAIVQAARVAKSRGLSEEAIKNLVKNNTDGPLFGVLGPEKINVLKLNLALDAMKKSQL